MATNKMIDDALEEILPLVGRPGRYTGGELNCITKDHGLVDLKFAIAFPDAYEIGMSNLACSILYQQLNERADCVAERVYAPWPDMDAAMRSAGVPLFTLESREPVRNFDMIGFALSFELVYTNVLSMLDLSGIPVRTSDRLGVKPEGGRWPIVIAGGHCTFNPEPMAPFIDVFVIGEAEAVLPQLLEAYKENRDKIGIELLAKLAEVSGCYVPALYSPVYESQEERLVRLENAGIAEEDAHLKHETMPRYRGLVPAYPGAPETVVRQWVKDVDALSFPTAPVIPFVEVVHDRISLEVMRGCTRGCRFCQAGMITRPVRERSPEKIKALADELIKNTGHEDISLVSLSTADYSQIKDVVTGLIGRYEDRKISVSLPSLRADKDCVDLVQEINKVRRTGLTFAPEAGSQRMRDVTNKGVTEENLFTACRTAFENGWQRVKLYFMISLPTETDEDVLAIGELATRCARIARESGVKSPTITIGVSAFVPKPFTPFQWHGQDTFEDVDRKQHLLKRSLRDRAINYRPNDSASVRLEALLSLGDRRVSDAIEAAWRAGQVFDAWDEHLDFDRWSTACQSAGIDPAYFANRYKDYAETLPWDHIDCGVSKAYLRAEDKRSRFGTQTADCHTDSCTFCDACDRSYTESRKGSKSPIAFVPNAMPLKSPI